MRLGLVSTTVDWDGGLFLKTFFFFLFSSPISALLLIFFRIVSGEFLRFPSETLIIMGKGEGISNSFKGRELLSVL